MNDSETLDDRILQFKMLELPGQPRMMHMGTSQLVSDMAREIERLRADNARLKEENKSLIEAITKLSTTIILDAVLEANIPDDVLEDTTPDPYTTRGFMADEPKNWSEG